MHDVEHIAQQFRIPGDFRSAAPYGNGHINDTYAAVFDQAGTPVRYIFQRINHNVFPDPGRLMENVERVCAHARTKLADEGAPDPSRRTLTLLPTRTGAGCHVEGPDHWRCYLFIEKARTYETIRDVGQAAEVARAFGRFQRLLADLPGERLVETIPDFHHTPKRFERLVRAFEADPHGRAAAVGEEIGFARRREADTGVVVAAMERGDIPERITHNDTKLNNVMLDDATGEGVCVIDLDTVMPGSFLYDFGDMVRTASNPEAAGGDLRAPQMRIDYFEALARGFLDGAGDALNGHERELLPLAGGLMALECGIRFLTDFLEGDVYFKVHREGHNLERCRNQFRLVTSIEEQTDAMRRLLDRIDPGDRREARGSTPPPRHA